MRDDDDRRDEDPDPATTIARPVDADGEAALGDGDEEELEGPGGSGRVVTVVGAVLLIVGFFLTWYHVVRPDGFAENTTGWQTFTRLRLLVLAASGAMVATALLRHSRRLAIARVVVGAVLAVLVIRRIVSPPDLEQSTVTARLGVYVSLLGALGVGFGGLMGLGAPVGDLDQEPHDVRVDGPGPAGVLPAGSPDAGEIEIADAEVVEDADAEVVEDRPAEGRAAGDA